MSTTLRPEVASALKTAGLAESAITHLASLQVPVRSGSTPITNLGFSKDQISKLPADCQHLTKDDLLSLGGWANGGKLTAAAAKLSTADVSAIRTVLGGSLGGGGKVAMDINCCCCPCCCATAVTAKKSIAKTNAVLVG